LFPPSRLIVIASTHKGPTYVKWLEKLVYEEGLNIPKHTFDKFLHHMPAVMEFAGLLFPPRDATPAEVRQVTRIDFDDTGLANGFQVMGKVSEEYNCLGWAVQSRSFLGDEDLLHDIGKLVLFMEFHGYELTDDQIVADIDVWGAQVGDWGGDHVEVTHFALKTEFGWTSKLGYDMLIVHGRYDLESLTDEEEGVYGEIMYHFKKKDGATPPQEPSLHEVCAMAKCNCSSYGPNCCSRNSEISAKI
jgi:hypothetical protein